jgi:hypothetical protein
MPLQDHFVPPLSVTHPWTGFHSAWATTIARLLNHGVLPPRYYAVPNVQLGGPVEIDVATLREANGANGGHTAEELSLWAPPAPTLTAAVDYSPLDVVEVQVLYEEGGPRLTAAIELVSPSNKDRPASRRAFAINCAGYLQAGASVVMVDGVTDRHANLHEELGQLLDLGVAAAWQSPTQLYATAYHTHTDTVETRLEVWAETLALGKPLPRMPLWLGTDVCVSLPLEESYVTTCADLRIRLAS